jgi:hypothetical protein
MTLTLEKLQRLKREAGGAVGTSATAGASAPVPALRRDAEQAIPASRTIETLRRLLRVRAPQRPLVAPASDRELPGRILVPGLHLVEAHLPDDALPDRFCGAFDRRDALDPARLLCFDTETTGLAGGTGTRAFMIGAADWHAGALRIRQLTISTMAAEAAMLDAFRDWLAPDTVLVSYNGKSYDAPLLATRYRLARRANPLAGLTHVDLLYPSRRRWRGVYENCRLATIERQVLQVVREDDLPGSQAPAAWLSYLRGGSARNLCRVLAHNHQDVVSLAHLLRRLSGDGHAVDAGMTLAA